MSTWERLFIGLCFAAIIMIAILLFTGAIPAWVVIM
jgi:hypothetical protein